MIEFIEGRVVEINPSYVVLSAGGVGYFIHISLNTFSGIQGTQQLKLYTHQVIREDAHLLFGFFTRQEREVFRALISVSGIGANTARMVLSALPAEELVQAIAGGQVNTLQAIKGIGAKSAQRMIIELKDKLAKDFSGEIPTTGGNTSREEALSALVMLGFNKGQAEKALTKILGNDPAMGVEDLVKQALKLL